MLFRSIREELDSYSEIEVKALNRKLTFNPNAEQTMEERKSIGQPQGQPASTHHTSQRSLQEECEIKPEKHQKHITFHPSYSPDPRPETLKLSQSYHPDTEPQIVNYMYQERPPTTSREYDESDYSDYEEFMTPQEKYTPKPATNKSYHRATGHEESHSSIAEPFSVEVPRSSTGYRRNQPHYPNSDSEEDSYLPPNERVRYLTEYYENPTTKTRMRMEHCEERGGDYGFLEKENSRIKDTAQSNTPESTSTISGLPRRKEQGRVRKEDVHKREVARATIKQSHSQFIAEEPSEPSYRPRGRAEAPPIEEHHLQRTQPAPQLTSTPGTDNTNGNRNKSHKRKTPQQQEIWKVTGAGNGDPDPEDSEWSVL